MEKWNASFVLLIGGLLLLGGLAWILGSPGGALPIAGGSAASRPEPAPESATEAAVEPEQGIDRPTGDAETNRPTPQTQREREAQEPPTIRYAVLVVDTDHNPVAGATVWWTPMSAGDSQDLEELQRRTAEQMRDPIAWATAHGKSAQTDAAGQVQIEGAVLGARIAARMGPLYGELYPARPDARGIPEVIELAEDRRVPILVRTDEGKPAEGVSVYAKLPKHLAVGLFSGALRHPIGWTDANGRIDFRLASLALSDLKHEPIAARTRIPGATLEGSPEIDLQAPPPSVVIRLPATGTLTLRLLDPWGRPITNRRHGGARIQVRANRHLPPDASAPLDGSGRVVFHRVALGREFLVDEFGRGTLFTERIEVAGPTAEQPHVEHELRPAQDPIAIRGRAVDAMGEPVADSFLSAAIGTLRVPTDGGGRFELFLDGTGIRRWDSLQVRTRELELERGLIAELPTDLRGSVNVGDLVFRPADR